MIYTHVLKTRVLSASGARATGCSLGLEGRGRQVGREHGPQHEGGISSCRVAWSPRSATSTTIFLSEAIEKNNQAIGAAYAARET